MSHGLPTGLLIIAGLALSCSPRFKLTQADMSRPSPWPFHRGDLSSQGNVHEGTFDGKLDVVWERKGSEKPAGPLSMCHGCLVYPGTKKKIQFYDGRTGEKRGCLKAHGVAQTGIAIRDTMAFFATSPRKSWLRCVSLRSGKQLWKRRVKDVAAGSIIVNNRLLIGSTNGSLTAYRPEDGSVIWTFEADGGCIAPTSYGNERIFQPGDDGSLYVISSDDGSELFRVSVDGPMVSAVAVSNTMVYAADVSGHVYGIKLEDGRIIWQTSLEAPVWTSPALSTGRLFIGDSGGELVALDATDGRILWRFNTGEVIKASATAVGECVVVGTMGGKLFSLDAADGSVIEQRQLKGAVAWSPVTDGDRVYVATESGTIICFGRKDAQKN